MLEHYRPSWMTEEHELLATTARRFTTEEIIPNECLQLFGGAGYMTEYPIARMYADARVMRIFGGTNEIMKELISRSL